MNSPWGIEVNILKELHWTRHYLLWRIPWPHVQLMLADAPRFKTGKAASKGKELESLEEFEDFLKM